MSNGRDSFELFVGVFDKCLVWYLLVVPSETHAVASMTSLWAMGERNRAFLALCLLLVGEVASKNRAIFAANVLGIFIVQLLKKCLR